MRRALRLFVVAFAAFFCVAAVVNVFGDDADVRREAEAVGCPRGCPKASSVQVSRTPFFEDVDYAVPDGTISVRCMRAAIFVGPYSCKKE